MIGDACRHAFRQIGKEDLADDCDAERASHLLDRLQRTGP